MATSRIAQHVGRVLGGRYRLVRPVGTGGSAHVYVAEDVTLRRRVAVKLLHSALADDASFLRRFQAEARAVAGLRHPNIVRVYDWGEDGGAPYLVMELLEGGSLRALLDAGERLSLSQAALLGTDAARGLDHAHRRGLVHRDIKPANILFDDEGRVCIADFGVARALADATWTEPAGAVLGTARYAAPEAVLGASLDGKADIYALGLVLIEAVTGTVPFVADTTIATLMGRVDRPVPVPEELGPLVPVLRRAGSPAPDDRPDAMTLARDLQEAAALLPASSPLRGMDPDAPSETGETGDVTEFPGRPALFDGDALAPYGLAAAHGPAESGVTGDERQTGGPLGATPAWVNGDAPARGWAEPHGVAPAPASTASSPPASMPSEGKGRRRRRRLVRRLAIALVALAVLAGAGVAAARALRPSHPVPALQGRTVADARAALSPLHLGLHVSAQVFDEQFPMGTVVRQRPAPPSRLKEGSTVSVDVSAGMPPVVVPDLSGLTLDQAGQRLAGAGLAVGTVSRRPDSVVPNGVVISWTGQGGQLPKHSPVDLVVSTGKPQVGVPDVHGMSFAQAKATLAGVGLVAVEDDEFNDAPAGQVVATTPPVGQNAVVGSQVTVTVSKGPDLVTVPNVGGLGVQAATARIEAAGMVVSGVVGSPDRAVSVTSPSAGARVKRGTAVRLSTS